MSEDDKHSPLCVDLDHSLLKTDVLWEVLLQLWRHPFVALRSIIALIRHGKAGFKETLATEIQVSPETLPYREQVLDYIKSQKATGRDIYLATATHRLWAEPIANHLGLFRKVFATENGVNLEGESKREALERAFGKRRFDYIGDHAKDLPIFASARYALLVEPSQRLLNYAKKQDNVSQVFLNTERQTGKAILRGLRIHQWVKNVLLCVPLLSAHLVLSASAWWSVLAAFISFGLVASATYIFNDLMDLQADRKHEKKRLRPFASGELRIQTGIALSLTCGILGILLSSIALPSGFTFYILVYIALTLGYSLYLKRRLLVDVLTLALLYTLRILAGGAAIGVLVSEWLLMFSLFIFLSLAFLKRAIELHGAKQQERLSGRGYASADLETIRVMGASSGLISVMVLALYISSPSVTLLYKTPKFLWLLCPLMIYWIARIWFMAAREQVHHDPVVFALYDWRSYIAGGCGLIILFLATMNITSLTF
jgi:4-hydroxybenzoate polyprenyltransferase/phosphoserine phosphatase